MDRYVGGVGVGGLPVPGPPSCRKTVSPLKLEKGG